MKRLFLATLLATLSTTALADNYGRGYGYRGYHHSHSNNDWLAPLIVGGVVGYVIAQPRQQTVIVQQPPYQPLPSYVPVDPIYQYQDIYDVNCSCYRRILVQIN